MVAPVVLAGGLASAGSILGGLFGSSAASKAAKAQAASAAQADATQRYMYDTTRKDNAPFRDTGVQANNQLAYLMGLGGGSGGGGGSTREQIRNELLKSYTKAATPMVQGGRQWVDGPGFDGGQFVDGGMGRAGTPESIDEAGLNAAIEARLAQQSSDQAAMQKDPRFGSLTRNFTMADRDADPVYQSGLQFGLDEGTKGINRLAAAGGSMLSGATLKALTRFGNDYGSTKANESFNRFNTNNTQQYNRLAGLSGAGRQATNQVGAAGQNMANQVSQNQIGAGNARASGYITQSNALQNGLNGAVSAWKNSYQPDPAVFDGGYSSGTGAAYAGTTTNGLWAPTRAGM